MSHSRELNHTATELHEKLKSLLRIVPHPLAVVASRADLASKPTGLLVSSFNSVTLQPIPFVSFNIRSVSTTLAAIKKSRSFVASIVDQPIIADAFAQRLPDSEEVKERVLKSNGELEKGNGGVIWLRCRYVHRRSVEVGDHEIVVGEVLDFGAYDPKYLSETAMVYCQGSYRRIKRPYVSDDQSVRGPRAKGGERESTVYRTMPHPPSKNLPR